MTKLVIITGLTGSGKTGLAVKIAKKYNGEIISADSVQIYKNLDIGSAKVTKEEADGVPHHLIDIRDFDQTYNVGEFVRDCVNAIDKIVVKGKLPIICGGTGLYIKALMEGYTLGDASNPEFRKKYQDMAAEKGNLYVWDILNSIAPEMAKNVHANNLKRVIRYLELATSNTVVETKPSPLSNFEICCVGIIDDRQVIYDKLDKRVDIMISQGLENEVKSLINQGAKREMQAFNSIDYKEWFNYFDGITSKERTIELIKQHNRNYCKRQLTFLKTIKNIKLLNKQDAEIEIERFLND